jgi:hypothetical protein
MNAKQKTEIIKMYAENIEAESDVKARIRQIERLKDTFGAEIPDCETLLREYAEKKKLVGVMAAFDVRDNHSPAPPITPPEKAETTPAPMPTYSPKTPEQLEADLKEFEARRMRYVIMMSLLDSMFRQEKITIESYNTLQDCFSEFYGFTQKSLFYWDGPRKAEPISAVPHKRNRTYTKCNTEYWDKYEKKHKKE